MKPFSEDEAGSLLINPFYAVALRDYLFKDRELSGAKEDWVLLNSKLIEDMGADKWLSELLDAVSQEPSEYDGDEIIDPGHAVIISQRLQGDHELLITREVWIGANVKAIKEYGTDKWLWRLLDVLETGGPES